MQAGALWNSRRRVLVCHRITNSSLEIGLSQDSKSNSNLDFVDGLTKRNTRCLICLEVIPPGTNHDAAQYCNTCPRTMHVDCLELPEDEKRNLDCCILCQNRGWHIASPSNYSGLEELEGEESLMAKAHRYGLWHEAVERGEIKRLEDRIEDNGSVEADRRVLLELGLVIPAKMRACRRSSEEEEEADDDEMSETESSQDTAVTDFNVATSTSPGISSSKAIDDLVTRLVQPKPRGSGIGEKRKASKRLSQNPIAKKARERRSQLTGLDREVRLGKQSDSHAVYINRKALRESDAYKELDAQEREAAEHRCREETMKMR